MGEPCSNEEATENGLEAQASMQWLEERTSRLHLRVEPLHRHIPSSLNLCCPLTLKVSVERLSVMHVQGDCKKHVKRLGRGIGHNHMPIPPRPCFFCLDFFIALMADCWGELRSCISETLIGIHQDSGERKNQNQRAFRTREAECTANGRSSLRISWLGQERARGAWTRPLPELHGSNGATLKRTSVHREL